jgi:hypothetical protein
MKMKYHYAEEKLYQAVHCLVTGIGMLNQRLAGAAHYLTRLNPEHFPDLVTSRKLQGIVEDLTVYEPGLGDEGKIDATTKRLSDYDMDRIANRILELYEHIKDVNRAADEHQDHRSRSSRRGC